MQYGNLKNLSLSFALLAICCALARAQTAPAKPQQPPQPPPPDTLRVVPSARQTPQIMTIVHRLNGIKALALLRSRGETISTVDDDLLTTPYAVTAVTAGFALGDGQHIIAHLPQAEAEVESFLVTPKLPVFTAVPPAMPEQRASTAVKQATTAPIATTRAFSSPESSSFLVVQSNGKQFAARYIGLDGTSGLSLLQIPGLKATPTKDADEAQMAAGQTVRIFAPDKIAHVASSTVSSTISLRIEEVEGKIKEIIRTTSGQITHLTISVPNLSAAMVGGIVLNESGAAVGIVETSNTGTARLIPIAAVRRAAERLLERQASIPRPWLGVRGEAVATTPPEKFFISGWTAPEVAALKSKLEGILLTAVAPGTPAALANLRPGDVIVRVNDHIVKDAEDFSFALNQAGSGSTARFTIFRGLNVNPAFTFNSPTTPPVAAQAPQTPFPPQAFDFKPFDINIKLGESLNPANAMKLAEAYNQLPLVDPFPPLARGIETASLSQRAAVRLGARGGLLVLYVDNDSLAAQAGLRPFDVIETIEGKLVRANTLYAALPKGTPAQLTLGVVRDKQRLEITIHQKETPHR